MEYTKDMILQVHYDKNNCENKGWTSRILEPIKKHKIITTAVLSAIIFISIDAILITNFFKILLAI